MVDGQPHTLSCQKTSTGLALVVDNRPPRIKSGTLGSVGNTVPLTIGVAAAKASTTGEWYNGSMQGITIAVG